MGTDFLIVGQGLAGSLLAWELIQRHYQVIIIDNGKESASQVAAGLINPVTGMRLAKTSDVDSLLPTAKQCYAKLGEFFRQDFYQETPMLRLLQHDNDVKQAKNRLANPGYQAYLGNLYPPENPPCPLVSAYGFLEQKQTGYLLTRPLLSCLKAYFIARQCYRMAAFNTEDIRFTPQLQWQDISPKRIIFCEGYLAGQNPWFSWLPFQPVKGEILSLQNDGGAALPDYLLNYGHWLIPLAGNRFRTGASFDRKHLDCQQTTAAKHELLTALAQACPALSQATVTGHQVHIRPCTLDKQAFIGFHPKQAQLAVFNGFGAKGSLQIPWYSQRFADSLTQDTPPPSNIARYYATHFPG